MRPAANYPTVVVLAGPNGAGKSTAAPFLLKGALKVTEFLNADMIARGLSPFAPESVAWEASEILLRRFDKLSERRVSFGLESTLATRSLASRLRKLIEVGYQFHLVFLFLPSVDLAVARVADRVRMGGHNVPIGDIRRRYKAGIRNFFELYQPLAASWKMYDGSGTAGPILIAQGKLNQVTRVSSKLAWSKIRKEFQL